MTESVLDKFFQGKTYDIRITHNGRWLDQKCTYDVVNFVADCILYYLENGGTQPFESPTIWRSDYAVRYVQEAFGKPYSLDEEPHDEFNKFFREPMKTLAAAGVLKENGTRKKPIQFTVENREMLEYIAAKPIFALRFLQTYIEKTLQDSGLWPVFERFLEEQTTESYFKAKLAFEKFCYENTPIRNKKETARIFPKVLNPLAVRYKKRGSVKGKASSSALTLSDLTYNRTNHRDEAVNKDKHVARRSFVLLAGDKEATAEYLIRKAMRLIKQFNTDYRDSKSEVLDFYGMGEPATQPHHIFPRSQFPDIADYVENIIMLTSGQHYEKAHPNGTTQQIDPGYQYLCLRYKVSSIKSNLENDQGIPIIYEFERLLKMLNCGFSTEYFAEIDLNDFSAVEEGIIVHYPPALITRYANINPTENL